MHELPHVINVDHPNAHGKAVPPRGQIVLHHSSFMGTPHLSFIGTSHCLFKPQVLEGPRHGMYTSRPR